MTSHFDSGNPYRESPSDDSRTAWNAHNLNSSMGALDMLKRDRFELLSAYLDGEVTAAERQQVEEWLAQDPVVQRLYDRLLKLRQGFQSIPVPATQPVDQTVDAVFARLDRQPKRVAWLWGGAAVAATLIGAVTTGLIGEGGLSPKIATQETPTVTTPVLIALDRPILNIPKTAVPTTPKPNSTSN